MTSRSPRVARGANVGRSLPVADGVAGFGYPAYLPFMILDLTDEETAALLRELDGIIENDRYFLSPQPLPPPKQYAPPRATVARRRRG